MEKIKKIFSIDNITKLVFIYVLLQPVLDILSFLNIRGYIPGISTILKPVFVFGIGTYIFFADKKSRQKYLLIYVFYAILMVIHSIILKDLMIQNSVILHEIRFMVNFIYMIVLFMIFEFLYRNNTDTEKFIEQLKKTIVIAFIIYCITIILAIITGTSAKTYEYSDASKLGYKGWLDSGQIFGHALCIVLPYLIHYLFNKEVKNKIIYILNKFFIILPIIILALIGTKVTYFLDILILLSHVIIDIYFGIRDKKKKYIFESLICLIFMVLVLVAYPKTPVKRNIDINASVLSVDMSKTSGGLEVNRKDLALMKQNIQANSNTKSWCENERLERLKKYYNWDLSASEILEEKYATGELHPSDMRNRQLIYNYNKYKFSSLQYKLFGIGYVNQDEYLSLERDSLMILFSFGIIGFLTILIKPIIIWIKSLLRILRNIKKVRPTSVYLFEGLSIFFCISLYAGYTFIYTNFSIFLVIVAVLLLDSLNKLKTNKFSKYFDRVYKNGREIFYKGLEENVKENKKQFIVTANPETIMTAEKDDEFKKAVLDENTTIVPDGVGILKGGKILGYDIKETILGVDIAKKLLELADKNKKKIFLFGAKKEVIEKFTQKIQEDYPKTEIIGAIDGYVDNKQEVFEKIKEAKPDIVLVALGIPDQEKLIYNNIKDFDKGIFVGVGGSFDVLSGMKKRAPKVFIKLKLEWLYRIVKEPKRLKRFYKSNIKYLFAIKKESELI